MVFLSGRRALKVFVCFAAAYLLSYAFRAVNAVIAPDLMHDAGLSNADLGLLSSAYFVGFASLQLPLGIWLDKYGPRRTEATLLLFAVAGSAIFALSSSLLWLWIARALIGVGVSGCLMASFKAYRLWFPAERQSQLTSWMLVAGTTGVLTTTVPVAAVMPLLGWRGIFWIMALLILLAAAAIYFFLKDVEHDLQRPAPANAAQSPGGYGLIFGNPYFRRIALLGLINHGTFLALQTLWAGPWMATVLGMDQKQVAEILFIFNLTLMFGYVALGWWGPRYVAHIDGSGWPVITTVAVGLGCGLLAQLGILTMTAPWAWILWLVLGLCVTVTTLLQSHLGLSFPVSLSGRANSAYNLAVFGGAFLAQWGIGVLIDQFKQHGASATGAMQGAFAVCLALQAGSLVAFVLNRARRGAAHT
jgi:MFS family permease